MTPPTFTALRFLTDMNEIGDLSHVVGLEVGDCGWWDDWRA